ncbi:hypothetical protein [Haloplasma contractile]|uniref:hypothetical protein n=1 Tax=Haloplasma contractile TaxID=471825 RepID=UPI000212120F|nr:hypothetical protein [Haloplasma contractile]
MRILLFNKNGDIRYFVLLKIVILLAIFYAQLASYFETKTNTISNASGLILTITVFLIIIQIMIYTFFILASFYDCCACHFVKGFSTYTIKLDNEFHSLYEQPLIINKMIEERTYLCLNVIRS